jgi:two-component system, NtrC family, sensor kinase
MSWRLALAALLVAVLASAVIWLSIQPMLLSLFELGKTLETKETVTDIRLLIPRVALLDIILIFSVVFGLLYFVVARPIRRAEEAVARIAKTRNREWGENILVGRLETSIDHLNDELTAERLRNEKQLRELTDKNNQLVRLQTELVSADRMATLGKLASGVAHEVGNPLSGILGYLSVVEMKSKGNEEILDLVRRTEGEVQRIDGIVRSLLDVGRPARQPAAPIDLRPVINGAVKLLSASKDFEKIQVSILGENSLWTLAEAGSISQVMINLLINSAQAMSGTGIIDVHLAKNDSHALIHVGDSGPGIPEGMNEKLFEPFFTTKPAGKGTGLGLAVSRHLLAGFDGGLTASNRPEGGAKFTMSIPLIKSA